MMMMMMSLCRKTEAETQVAAPRRPEGHRRPPCVCVSGRCRGRDGVSRVASFPLGWMMHTHTHTHTHTQHFLICFPALLWPRKYPLWCEFTIASPTSRGWHAFHHLRCLLVASDVQTLSRVRKSKSSSYTRGGASGKSSPVLAQCPDGTEFCCEVQSAMHTHTRTHTHTHTDVKVGKKKAQPAPFASNSRTIERAHNQILACSTVEESKTGKGSEQSTPHTKKILLSCCCRCCSCLEVPGVFGGRGRATQCVQGAHTTSSSLIISASECFFLCVGVTCVCQSVTTRVPLPNGLTAFSALVSRPSASVH